MAWKDYIYKVHCENGCPSSKRLYGGLMIVCSQLILITATILSFIDGTGITTIIKELIETDIVIGSMLIGLNTITSVFKSGTSITNQQKTDKDNQ